MKRRIKNTAKYNQPNHIKSDKPTFALKTWFMKMSPAKKKITVFPMNSIASQTICTVSFETKSGQQEYAIVSPAQTVAMTPLLASSLSAMKKARYPQQIVTTTCIIASAVECISEHKLMIAVQRKPIAKPMITDGTIM
jgi:hypothetical protein